MFDHRVTVRLLECTRVYSTQVECTLPEARPRARAETNRPEEVKNANLVLVDRLFLNLGRGGS